MCGGFEDAVELLDRGRVSEHLVPVVLEVPIFIYIKGRIACRRVAAAPISQLAAACVALSRSGVARLGFSREIWCAGFSLLTKALLPNSLTHRHSRISQRVLESAGGGEVTEAQD